MNRVKRWHAFPIIGEQTTADHSWGVAAIICLITEPSVKLLKAALFHDTAEWYTGDVPHQSKRDWPSVARAVNLAEEQINGFLTGAYGIQMYGLSEEEENILKWADMCELAFFCKHQIQLGNTYLLDTYVEVVEKTLLPNPPTEAAKQLVYTHFMLGVNCNGRK
jgi:5'-deoxynucleotidase YfbR-like HD superfamily hydrolase